MNEKIVFIADKIKKDKKISLILAFGFLGMLLLLFSTVSSKETKTANDDTFSQIKYLHEETENRLEELLSTVDGVGKVKVMVTVESLTEQKYAENYEIESGAEKYESVNEYVLIENGGDTTGLIINTVTPKIRGVGVSCEGGASAVVKQEVKKLISATLGIGADKISVTKMKE